MGVSTQPIEELKEEFQPAESSAPEAAAQKLRPPTEDLPADTKLEDLFASAEQIDAQDADAFWESFSTEEVKPELSSGDSLSYDQAAKLGLAPEDE
jgi:hypothetical protein